MLELISAKKHTWQAFFPLKSDKRDALGLANQLYNQLEKGIQVGDPLQAVRRLVPPSEAAASLRGMVRHH